MARRLILQQMWKRAITSNQAEKRRRMEPCKCIVNVVDRVPLAFTYVYLSMTYCTEIDAAGFNVQIEFRALKRRCWPGDKVV